MSEAVIAEEYRFQMGNEGGERLELAKAVSGEKLLAALAKINLTPDNGEERTLHLWLNKTIWALRKMDVSSPTKRKEYVAEYRRALTAISDWSNEVIEAGSLPRIG